MKHLLSLFALLISLSVNAQPESSRYQEVKDRIRDNGYSISQEWFANIAQGGSFSHSFTFHAGETYVIAALSDDGDVTDVDLSLLYANGEIFGSDNDASDIAVVHFTPSNPVTLTVLVKNYSSNDPDFYSRCRFVIGYKAASYSSLND